MDFWVSGDDRIPFLRHNRTFEFSTLWPFLNNTNWQLQEMLRYKTSSINDRGNSHLRSN